MASSLQQRHPHGKRHCRRKTIGVCCDTVKEVEKDVPGGLGGFLHSSQGTLWAHSTWESGLRVEPFAFRKCMVQVYTPEMVEIRRQGSIDAPVKRLPSPSHTDTPEFTVRTR
jgi:hypothetical protein